MALDVLFSKEELTLVKNNKYLTLRKRYDEVEHSSGLDDNQMFFESPTPRLKWLYEKTQLID